MSTSKKKFKSQTRSSKTKATHVDPHLQSKRKHGPHITLQKAITAGFEMAIPKAPKRGSWWVDAQRADFYAVAHERDSEMRYHPIWQRNVSDKGGVVS